MSDIKTNLSVEEMEKAGVHLGHRVSRLHPKMKPYVSGIKHTVHTFDLEKTAKAFGKALDFISKVRSKGGVILFVGTKPHIRAQIKQTAIECKMPYVVERWLGGTFTNFETIKKRVDHFKDLEKKKQSGELNKYTKKERLLFDREINGLSLKFEGIRNMEKLPEVVFVVGLDKDMLVARESKMRGIPVMGLVDTNIDPKLIDYPIPANDDAISSVKFILEKVKETILGVKT